MPLACPCGNSLPFSDCCAPVLCGARPASSAEALMRSRYTAFVVKDLDYLCESMHPATRDHFDRQANREWADKVHFYKLEIQEVSEVGDAGQVVFRAHYTVAGRPEIHSERSTFRRAAGRWYFVEGVVG